MKRFLPPFGFLAAVGVICWLALTVIVKGILLTVSTALVGQELYVIPWILLMMLFYLGVTLPAWAVHKSRDGVAKREYLAEIGEKVWDRKVEGRRISRDLSYRLELVAYALVASVEISVTFHPIYNIVCLPLMYAAFHVFNRFLWLRLHKEWAEGRMHRRPEGERSE